MVFTKLINNGAMFFYTRIVSLQGNGSSERVSRSWVSPGQ
jgi:hypothetical protein